VLPSLAWRGRLAAGGCVVAAFCVLALALSAAEPPGYYNSAAGLTGAALRSALHNIIDDHTVVSYANARFALENLDEDPANSANLILIYERSSWPKAWWVSTHVNGWNREHCWPNSLGIDNSAPAYSDLFNLRAAGEASNSDRSNLYYDESTPWAAGYQQPAGPTTPLCSEDFDSWEPPLEVKGDLARSMFYMDVRYEGDSGEPNLILTDNTSLISATAAHMGRLSTLLVWHFLDPISAAERQRVERTYGYQSNRNPFVDRPEFVEKIYGAVLDLAVTKESSATMLLSWPAILPPDLAFIETSTDLRTWAPANLTVIDQNGRHTARVPITPTARFYRLKLVERPG
jgi:endonuclease I